MVTKAKLQTLIGLHSLGRLWEDPDYRKIEELKAVVAKLDEANRAVRDKLLELLYAEKD